MINKAVPSCGGPGIALSWVEACDCPKRGQLGCEIFGSGGLRSRVPLLLYSCYFIETMILIFEGLLLNGSLPFTIGTPPPPIGQYM